MKSAKVEQGQLLCASRSYIESHPGLWVSDDS